MSISLLHDHDNVYRMEVSGLLRKAEWDRYESTMAGEMRRSGHVKLLVVIQHNFEGWERGVNWNDLTFYVAHGDEIDRIAIVGDDRWKADALVFAAAGLRKAPVEFFTPDDVARATAWLSA